MQRLIVAATPARAALPVPDFCAAATTDTGRKSLDEALNALQRGTQSSTASAVNKLAVRLAAGNDRLAELVRRDQDLAAEADVLDKAIVAAVSRERAKRDVAAEQRARSRLAAIETEPASLQKTFAAEFRTTPHCRTYSLMISKEIQALLSTMRRWCCFAVTVKESYVVAVTRER